jgi:hypothetical protein
MQVGHDQCIPFCRTWENDSEDCAPLNDWQLNPEDVGLGFSLHLSPCHPVPAILSQLPFYPEIRPPILTVCRGKQTGADPLPSWQGLSLHFWTCVPEKEQGFIIWKGQGLHPLLRGTLRQDNWAAFSYLIGQMSSLQTRWGHSLALAQSVEYRTAFCFCVFGVLLGMKLRVLASPDQLPSP